MTVAKPEDFTTGLEDFSLEDAVIPRLTIVHKDAQWKDSLSGEQFDNVFAIMLGLVKQRVLWHATVDEGDWPMCRSPEHNTGFPNLSDDQPKDKRFPWEKSGFDQKDFPPDENGTIRLPCAGCQLKEWESHPDGKRPYCSEQFTIPVLYVPGDGDMNDWTAYVPAIMTFQKTSLKPLKNYLTSFARSKQAAFQAITQIGLTPQKRGTTDYAVANFRKVGATDQDNHRDYMTNFLSMRDFLTAEPGSREEKEDGVAAPSTNEAKPPAKTVEEQDDKSEDIVEAQVVEDEPEQQAKATSTEAAAEDDDDLPF